MKFSRSNRNGAKQLRESARPQRPARSAACAVEPLEARQLFSVTGFSLVDQSSFPGAPTTVTNQPTVFQSTLQKTWLQLVGGQLKINGQTLGQTIASAIQQGESSQGLSAYDISSGFDGTPVYNGSLKETSSGPVLQLALEAAQGYTHLLSSLDSSGNLVLTAQKSSLTVNGSDNDHITISSCPHGAVMIAAGGQTQTFAPGYLNSITVNDNCNGKNTVDIPSLPAGVAVQVNDSSLASDTVDVGNGSLAKVAGSVNVNNTFGETALTVDDWNDTAASKLTVTNKAVAFNGRNVVTYATSGGFSETTLTVQGGPKDKVTIDSSSTPVTVMGMGTAVQVGNRSLAALGGTVKVSNFGTVFIDDYNDTVSRNVELSSVSTIVGASSTVAFGGLSTIQLGYVTGVTISDGSANNAFDAQSSPSNDFFSIAGHFGDSLTGPAASQVQLNLFGRIAEPITTPIGFLG